MTLSRLEVLGESGKGFLLVFTEPIANRTKGWIKKYDTKESIEILIAQLTDQEMKSLRDEKVNNVEGMISGTQGYTSETNPTRTTDSRLVNHTCERRSNNAILALPE